jgi:hypothetical protein
MENCCDSTRRLGERIEAAGNDTLLRTEVQLTEPMEHLMLRGLSWKDVYSFVRAEKKLVWVSPTAFLSTSADEHLFEVYDYELYFGVEWMHWTCIQGEEEGLYLYTHKESHEELALAAEFLRNLLATKKGINALLHLRGGYGGGPPGLVSGPALSRLLSETRQGLGNLTFDRLAFSEEHWRALTSACEPNLDIVFDNCTIAETGYGAFLDFLQRPGAVSLCSCTIDADALASALRGNTCISELRLHSYDADSDYVATVAQALAENEGLQKLYLAGGVAVNDETWECLFSSIHQHPQLEILGLVRTGGLTALTKESKTARMKAVVEMLECNRLIQRIALSEDERISKSIENPLPRIFRRITTGRAFKGSNELVRVHAGKRCSDLVCILVSENVEMINASSWRIRRIP